jgi:hypothetical protein
VSCALDPAVERPEEREFEVDLHEVVPRRRAELAVAALTVVRVYLAAGEPKVDVPNFADSRDWSRFVRKPLVWLGREDPCKGRERVEGRDPVRGAARRAAGGLAQPTTRSTPHTSPRPSSWPAATEPRRGPRTTPSAAGS